MLLVLLLHLKRIEKHIELINTWENKIYSATRLTVSTQQTFTFDNYVKIRQLNNPCNRAVFNLQLRELCKEAWLSIKFTHSDWRTICEQLR